MDDVDQGPSAQDSSAHIDSLSAVDFNVALRLEERLGRVHARQRLGIERDYEAFVFGHGLNLFHIENWHSSHALIGATLKVLGLYWIGKRNAARVQLRENFVRHSSIPKELEGFRLLHISDPHADFSAAAIDRAIELIDGLDYSVCVLTGDYRGRTYGPCGRSLEGMARLCTRVTAPMYGVLGNHDSILMVPALEEMGVRLLLNEAVSIEHRDVHLTLAGVDDAHYFRVDNVEKAAAGLTPSAFSILLSHTPEIYRQAAHAGFDVMFCGHTHGGQICLPGGVPLKLNSVSPRFMGAGAWSYGDMYGYTSSGLGTSVVPVRLNCPPEITLHTLKTG